MLRFARRIWLFPWIEGDIGVFVVSGTSCGSLRGAYWGVKSVTRLLVDEAVRALASSWALAVEAGVPAALAP